MYHPPNIGSEIKSRKLKWADYIVGMEEGRTAFKILEVKPSGKRPLGRPRRRWEDKITVDIKKIGISTRSWVDSAKGRNYRRALVNAALNLWVP